MDSTNSCCCCLQQKSEKQFAKPYYYFGRTEIYSDMLQECFDLNLTVNSDMYGICEVCVGRLRDASDFKRMVQQSQAKLQLLKHEPSIVKQEFSTIPDESCSVYVHSKQEVPIELQITFKNESEPHESTDVLHTSQTFDSNTNPTMAVHNDKVIAGKSDTFENQFTKFCLENNKDPKTKRKNAVKCTRVIVPKKPKSEGPFNCDGSSLTFVGCNNGLGTHKRIHQSKTHACHICSKVFKLKKVLTKHVKGHSGERPFGCDACDKRFTTKFNLESHQRLHSGERFICDICNKRFMRKKSLSTHIQAHMGVKCYKCKICDATFGFKCSLKTHTAIHEEKQFVCELCSKTFRRKHHLQDHLKTHAQHRAFECQVCGRNFVHRTNWSRHCRRVHKQ